MESFNIAFSVDFNVWYPSLKWLLVWCSAGVLMMPIVIFRTMQTSRESIMTKSEIKKLATLSILLIVLFPPIIGVVLRAIKESKWKFNFKTREFEFNN